ncbi:MAG: 3'-5' exonuclease [Candidatus Pacearchaeota archaeon]|nr:3'-5' exonuclease [Candidatus Pacearchaeota archaeon]
MKPIVVDIEMSGVDAVRCGIWQIGAIDLETKEEFLEEGRIDDEDEILNEPDASRHVLEVIGKTEEELRDKTKQSQKKLLEKFFKWVETRKMKNLVCQNAMDISFLDVKLRKYKLVKPYHFRFFDTHSIAHTIYFKIHGKFFTEGKRFSNLGLKNILKMCGMKDNRDTHNALEDAKLTAECFSRLMFGEKLLEEYSRYEIPKELKK